MYCLNLHPGESLSEVIDVLRGDVAAVKRAIAPEHPYEIGLRLGNRAAAEALLPSRLAALRQVLGEGGFVVRHMNGFPYGKFHRTAVKTRVYTPDWSTRERLDYTLDLARILASLLPENETTGTISTLPFGYRGATRLSDCLRLVDEAEKGLYELEAETGKNIVLAFEPEPDCVAGSVSELLACLAPARHRTILVDTCHAAVVGERTSDCVRQILRAGFPFLRAQISAAIVADSSQFETLAGFSNPVYLHQTHVYTKDGEKVAAFPDLSAEALAYLRRNRNLTAKVHCHVPLNWRGSAVFGSSAEEITDDFLAECRRHGAAMEIETYTYEVLPGELRPPCIVQGIIAEEIWFKHRLQSTVAP